MPTKIEQLFPNGERRVIDVLEAGVTLHAYSEERKNWLNKSILVCCPLDEIRAEIFEPPEPEKISDPTDKDVIEKLCTAENYSTYVLRNDSKVFDMEDFEDGPYQLIVRHMIDSSEIQDAA